MTYQVILFYKFTPISNPALLRDEQKALCQGLGLTGRMLIAEEGINATFEGELAAIKKYQQAARQVFGTINFKESAGTGRAFSGLKIKVRPEIVTLGRTDLDVPQETAPTVTADELATMYERSEDFVILDLRNDYEIKAGQFEKTVDPGLHNFRDLPAKLEQLQGLKNKKVVAVCTGGIRCEKATCLLKREGFNNLYQLQDGIHTYLVKYPGKQGRFKGTLFVFDNRLVTPVVEGVERDVIGSCTYCQTACETFYNDDSVRPSRKVLCCADCIAAHRQELRTALSLV